MAAEDDHVHPFQIEATGLRGRFVRLGPAVDAVLSGRSYPPPVAALLGETLVLAVVLSAGLKFDGVFTLQVKGDGPVGLLVADVTSAGAIRGYAQFDPVALARAVDPGPPPPEGASVPRLLGSGYLAFTVDQGPDTDRYQGIVELAGQTMAECAHEYFRRSEQVQAAVKIAIGRTDADGAAAWRAAAMMVQRLPRGGRQHLSGESGDEADDDAWRRAVVLLGSATSDELLDPSLHPHRLLFRLFHEDGVRVFSPAALRFGCRCSRQRVEHTLQAFPRAEIGDMKIDGKVVVTCEFCNSQYEFSDEDLDHIYGETPLD